MNALRLAMRRSTRVLQPQLRCIGTRAFSMKATTSSPEHQRSAEERNFVNQMDRENVRNLLLKLEHMDADSLAAARAKLTTILEKHGVKPEEDLLDALREWRINGPGN